MKCPMCGKNRLIEIESSPIKMSEVFGYSIKECQDCKFKVKDRTSDGRFVGVIEVLNKGKVR